MKKLKCFLCGAKYSTENRIAAATVFEPNSEEPYTVSKISFGNKTLRLCPACIKAATFGMTLACVGNDSAARWGGEEVEYEEE